MPLMQVIAQLQRAAVISGRAAGGGRAMWTAAVNAAAAAAGNRRLRQLCYVSAMIWRGNRTPMP